MMPAIGETVFDILYLIFAFCAGIVLLLRAKGRKDILFFGLMTILLGAGDSFHLIPRVINYWSDSDLTVMLGIGKLVTSVTMTVFYLLFEFARRKRYMIQGQKVIMKSIWILFVLRIVLCCFPQNGWTSKDPSFLWAIMRNAPFFFIGIITVVMWYMSAKHDKALRFAYLAVLLSFLFYFPVVIWSQDIPLIGMLMLPKTCMYIWLIVMFLRALKQENRTADIKAL